jgi:filamentous hemagglutinin family protein
MRPVSSAPSGPVRFLGVLLLSGGLLLGGLGAVSLAQVTTALTPDGTLGTAVSRTGTIYTITGGTRPGNGPNLFHSFERFSIGTGDIASFTGPQTGITNILSRVTGGQRSDIDGTLRSEIPGAHLYLLNPAGVLFRPNASLDVSGSFHVSTADYLRLADGARFVARLSDTSTLSMAPPVAFGFLGPPPATITVQGSTLEVPEGQTMSAIGGDVQIVGGRLTAPSGRINIASVASPGEVSLTAPGIDGGSFAQLGDIHLSHSGLLDVRGAGGGTVVIRGGQLAMESGAAIVAGTSGDIDGGGIDIAVRGLTLTGGAQIASLSAPPGQGAAGAIVIRADRVTVQGEGSAIGSDTSGAGASGMVMVEAGRVTVREGGAILSSTEGAGPAGNITIKAGALEMDGGVIQARAEKGSTGSAGAITVTGFIQSTCKNRSQRYSS